MFLCLFIVSFIFSTVHSKEFWQCPQNNDACTEPDCSYTDQLRRAQVLCDVYPWYAGSIGEDWVWEGEWYECQSNNFQGIDLNYCLSWTANEVSNTEQEVGTCECQTPATIINDIDDQSELNINQSLTLISTGNYCDSWICSQMEFDFIETVDCDYGDKGAYYDYNAERYVCPKNEFEFTECWCTLESNNSLYCQEWYCEESVRNAHSKEDKGIEKEYYTCISNIPALNISNFHDYKKYSGNFCWEWTGKINSKEEFEFSTCKCLIPDNNGTYCSYWECDEKEMGKINMGLEAAFWMSWIIGFIYYCNFTSVCWIDCDKECYWIPLLFMTPFLFLCLISGGITAVLFFIMLNVLVCMCCAFGYSNGCDCDDCCNYYNWNFNTEGKKCCCLDCCCIACDIECGIDINIGDCLRGIWCKESIRKYKEKQANKVSKRNEMNRGHKNITAGGTNYGNYGNNGNNEGPVDVADEDGEAAIELQSKQSEGRYVD